MHEIEFSTAVQYLRHIWSYDDPVLIRFVFSILLFFYFSGGKGETGRVDEEKKSHSLSSSIYLSV